MNAGTIKRMLFGLLGVAAGAYAVATFGESGASSEFAIRAGFSVVLCWMAATGSGCG